MCTENNCSCRECIGLRLIGPGDDNYGQDNMLTDWACPQCKKITQITQLEDRLSKSEIIPINCKFCGWENGMAKDIREIVERVKKDNL
jgi:hypothetical protein